MSEDHTGSVRDLLASCLLYKCLMESIQLLGLSCAVRVEDEDDTVSLSLDGGPALLVLLTATAVPQLNLGLQQYRLQLTIFSGGGGIDKLCSCRSAVQAVMMVFALYTHHH